MWLFLSILWILSTTWISHSNLSCSCVVKVYEDGRNVEIETYLKYHAFYAGQRYIHLGRGWLYDFKTKTAVTSFSSSINASHVYVLNLYHVYEEDTRYNPKHFIHKGIYSECCIHWNSLTYL